MHVEYIRFDLNSGTPEAFLETWQQAHAVLRRSPLIEAIEVAQRDDRKTEFVVRVEWIDEQARAEYRTVPDYHEFLGMLEGYVPVSMDLFAPLITATGAGRSSAD